MRITKSIPPLLCALLATQVSYAAGLPDTGQTGGASSGDATAKPRQDGRFGRDAAVAARVVAKVGGGAAGFDYSKVANNGSIVAASTPLGFSSTNWACTQDNITGLMWEVKGNFGSLRDKGWTYSWYNSDGNTNGGNAGVVNGGTCFYKYDATTNPAGNYCSTAGYVAAVNTAALCGYSDWRLPSKRELQTITNLGAFIPAIDTTYFINTDGGIGQPRFWTDSTYVPNSTKAWSFDYQFGNASAIGKAANGYVRLVRGGQF